MHRSQTGRSKSAVEMGEFKLVQRPSAPSEYTLTKNSPSENYRNFECNGKLYSSVWPLNIDLLSLSEQDELKDAPWFQVGLPREVSLEILLQQPPGAFLMRLSESHRKCFALSLRVAPLDPPKLAHYLIEKSHRGFRFKGNIKEFASLKSLVIHHSVLKEHLPIPLDLPRIPDTVLDNLIVYETTTRNTNEEVKSPPTTLCWRRSKEKWQVDNC